VWYEHLPVLDPVAVLELPGLVLDEELGHGSYSVVYRARRGDRPCAVKIAHGGARATRWFRREAAALARVSHEGVPAVLEIGEHRGRPYIVMELVEGVTLARRLEAGFLTEDETIALGLRLASIADAIHARGLVHRDIKPHNIVIDPTGRVRLVDFGLVTQVHVVGELSEVAGTRSYAAPEQLQSPQLVDARSDLYGIGRVLLDCVASKSARAPAPLATVLDHLLADSPAQRYPSAVALAADLQRVADGERPLGPRPIARLARPSESMALVGRGAEQKRIEGAWSAARAGRGRVLLLEGPPGSGKTRLMGELARSVARDASVLRLDARGVSPAPLATLRQLFDQHIAELETLPATRRDERQAAWRHAAQGPASTLVASVSPPFARLLGETATPPEREHEPFVEAMAATFVKLARTAGPVLLCIDDLQWLDPVSREVLVRVALGATDVPMLVVAAARTDARSLPPVERFVRTLGQDRLEVLGVRGLSNVELEAFVASYLGSDHAGLDSALTRRVVGLSEGTPLGALAILDALIDGGALRPHWGTWRFDAEAAERIPLPRGASALLRKRLSTLPPATICVLQAAAVIGPYFEQRRVAAVVGISTDDCGLALYEARRAGLVDVDEVGRPRFVHESVREALLAALEASERRSLHQRVANVLDAEGGSDPTVLFATASHYARGEPERDPSRVYLVARAAAEQASASLDHESALPLFELARRASSNADIALDAGFHREVAECQIRGGMLDEALACLGEALTLVDTKEEQVEVLARLAWVHQLKADAGKAWASLQRAFGLLDQSMPTERPQAVARTMVGSARARIGAWFVPAGRRDSPRLNLLCALHYQNARLGVEYDKPFRILQSALAILSIGERLEPSSTMALAQGMYGMFMTVLGRRKAGARFIAKAEENAKALNDPACMARTLQFSCMVECFGGGMDRALDRGRLCLDTYGHWIDVTDYCLVAGSMQLIESVRGRPREAFAWLERALSRGRRDGDSPAVVTQVIVPEVQAVLATLGREETTHVRELIREGPAFEELRGFYRLASWGPRALRFAEAGGDDDEFEALVQAFERERHSPKRAHMVVVVYYVAIAQTRARQCMRAEDAALPGLLEKFDRALGDLRKAAGNPLLRGHLLALEGHRALLVDDHARAWERFRDAKALGERETAPWVLYTVARGEAHLLRREGREEAAIDQAKVAALLAREHGAVHRLRWIEEEFGLEPVASSREGSRRTGSRLTPASMRHRQLRALLDVVRAVAREQKVQPQARVVLEELLRLMDAWRGLVLFERSGGSSARVLVGRERDRGDWTAADAEVDLRDRLQKVCDTGEPEQRAASESDELSETQEITLSLDLYDETVGALYLARGPDEPGFTPDDVELLETLTPQVATTLELARLLEDRERLEESLRQAQKMEAVGQLASGIAHDFNNSLMAISSAASELARSGPLAEREQDLIEIIQGSSDRSATLTRQLLAFSRRQVLEYETMDTGAVVDNLVPMLGRIIGEGIVLVVEPPETPRWVKTDRASLENAIVNLVVNARDAMPDGGRITITVSEVELDEAWIPRGVSSAGPHVRISVEDTGSGISPEILDRIFDPFYTTKEVGDGTGLGLASVYGFVKQSGGCVDVYSKVGVGSEFSLYLPSVEGTPTPVVASSSSTIPSPTSGPAIILLVDDEPLVRRALERTLKADGYELRTAANGSEALEKICAEGPVDLVIADVLMPVLSGPQLASRLCEAGFDIPILFISGYPDGALVDEGVLRSGVAFLQKPFDNEVLKARVTQMLRTRARAPKSRH
jgi:eukaryotic-like serine/threonine-protein kinase